MFPGVQSISEDAIATLPNSLDLSTPDIATTTALVDDFDDLLLLMVATPWNPATLSEVEVYASDKGYTINQRNFALQLDGTNDGVIIPIPDDGLPETVTLEALIETSGANVAMIFHFTESEGFGDGFGSNNEMHLNVASNGQLLFWCRTQGFENFNIQGGAVINDGAVHRVSGVIDIAGATARTYVDGIQQASGAIAGTVDFSAFTQGNIGFPENATNTFGQGRLFKGRIDDCRIWSTVRTVAEISDNQLTELIGTETGLLAYWKFNETSGTIAKEFVNSLNGQLVGARFVEWADNGLTLVAGNETISNRDIILPIHTDFPPRLVQSLNVQGRLFRGDEPSGQGDVSFGNIVLANSDQLFDAWFNYNWDGRLVRIFAGKKTFLFDQFTEVFRGTAQDIEFGEQSLTILLRDKRNLLDILIPTDLYAGTGNLEGGADLVGQPKPLALGHVINVTPRLLDASNLVYQVNNGLIRGIDAVRDQGVALNLQQDVSNVFTVSSVSAGGYITSLKTGVFRLGATPNGQVTADLRGARTSAVFASTTAQIVKDIVVNRIAQNVLNENDDLDGASFNTLDVEQPATVGIYVDQQQPASDVVDQLLGGIGGWWAFNTQGILEVGRLKAPLAATTVADATFTKADIISIQRLRSPIASWRRRIGYKRNYTVQGDDDLAGAVSAADRELYGNAFRFAELSDTTIRQGHALARDVERTALFQDEANAVAETARQQIAFGFNRSFYRVRVQRPKLDIWLDSIVQFDFNERFFSSGKIWIVVGIERDPSRGQTVLTVWGPAGDNKPDMTPDNAVHSHESSTIGVGGGDSLEPANATHGHKADNVSFAAPATITVENIQTTTTTAGGNNITIASYSALAGDKVVVSIGAQRGVARTATATFAGNAMTEVATQTSTDAEVLIAYMFEYDVAVNTTGDIVVTYNNDVDRSGMEAKILRSTAGTAVKSTENENTIEDPGEDSITTTEAAEMIAEMTIVDEGVPASVSQSNVSDTDLENIDAQVTFVTSHLLASSATSYTLGWDFDTTSKSVLGRVQLLARWAPELTGPVSGDLEPADATHMINTDSTAFTAPGSEIFDFYVSSSLGSDSNNGTSEATPWRTMAKVNGQSFAAGARIGFRRGDVWARQQLVCPSNGTPGNKIVFGAYGTGTVNPTLDGEHASSLAAVDHNNKDYVRYENIRAIRYDRGGAMWQITNSANVDHVGCECKDNFVQNGFNVRTSSDILFDGVVSTGHGNAEINPPGPRGHAWQINASSNVVIRNSIGNNCTEDGIQLSPDAGQTVTCENSVFNGHGEDGVDVKNGTLTINDCSFTNTTARTSRGGETKGRKGINCNSGADAIIMNRCVVFNWGLNAIGQEPGGTVTATRCLFVNEAPFANGAASIDSGISGKCDGMTFESSIMVMKNASKINVYGKNTAFMRLRHCTLYREGNAENFRAATCDDVVLHNNIVYNADEGLCIRLANGGQVSTLSGNVVFVAGSGTTFGQVGSTTYGSGNIAAWHSATGGDNTTYGDPAFPNPGGTAAADYVIAISSTADGAGTSGSGVTDDYLGNTFASPPAAGALEAA